MKNLGVVTKIGMLKKEKNCIKIGLKMRENHIIIKV